MFEWNRLDERSADVFFPTQLVGRRLWSGRDARAPVLW